MTNLINLSKNHNHPFNAYQNGIYFQKNQTSRLFSMLKLREEIGVQHILCCVFALRVLLPVSLDCLLFDCPFGVL
jgi:hypothetical protein